ncbi:hypothetical protein [Falsibacillus albus]|uniref:Uncharacterized protein n=1 Tax=Falsibacillus albus TaxID=2478915 RepID=A0A3L7K4B8_9BACI|nr:hypothetical protein [Falsibacillus albus]RLQ97903.1 hypothetical protein D9X91_00480 [Falsibacillus albus]
MNYEEGAPLDFSRFREKKQNIAEDKTWSIYLNAIQYAERKVNIREKVRGKHIFSQLVDKGADEIIGGLEEAFFEWFLFDYKTISGKTIFHTFMNHTHQEWTEPERIQGALFLTAALEPVEITDVLSPNQFEVMPVLGKGSSSLVISKEPLDICVGYAFLRKIPLITTDMLIGSVFVVKEWRVIEKLLADYKDAEKRGKKMTWRAFLKENSMKYAFCPESSL